MIQNQISTIEKSKSKEEQNEEQFNQTLAEKESQILELQDKLDGLIQPRMNSARSREELEAIDSNEGGLIAVTKQLKKIVSLLMVRCPHLLFDSGVERCSYFFFFFLFRNVQIVKMKLAKN